MKSLLTRIVLIILLGIGGGLALRAVRKGPDVVLREVSNVIGSKEQAPPTEPSFESIPGHSAAQLSADKPEGWLTEFSLTERNGETVTTKDLLGKPYVVSFFFSTCPSVCVMQNQHVQQLQEAFKGQPVRFVSISVDPETDQPEVLREYAKRFGADDSQWLFLTGDLTHIRRVAGEIYSLPAEKQGHSEKLVLVNHQGEIVDRFSWRDARQFEKLKEAIKDDMAEVQP